MNARPINRALNNTVALRDWRTRAFITASVATAAWHGGNWWWRHRNGGFGWVGPLFWPFAFYDIYDYAFWGYPYDDAFWGYGYPDLYAGIFGLYGYDDLMGYAGYLPRYAGRRGGNLDAYANVPSNRRTDLAQMCGDDSRVIAGLPIEAFQDAIQRTRHSVPRSKKSPTLRKRQPQASGLPAPPTLRSRRRADLQRCSSASKRWSSRCRRCKGRSISSTAS